MIEIVVAAEDRFGVLIPDDELPGLRTVGDVIAYTHHVSMGSGQEPALERAKPPKGCWPEA